MRKFLAVLALALTSLSPLAVQAQESAAQSAPEENVYATLFATIQSGVDQDVVVDNMLQEVARQLLVADPQLAQMEAEMPGLMNKMMAAMRPKLKAYQDRINREYNPRFQAILADLFTEREAVAITQFYASDIGQRVLQVTSQNIRPENSATQAVNEEEISTEAIAQDDAAAISSTLASFTPEEMAEINRKAMAVPGMLKMAQFPARTRPLRAEMENAPMLPEEEAALSAVIEEVVLAEMERAGLLE